MSSLRGALVVGSGEAQTSVAKPAVASTSCWTLLKMWSYAVVFSLRMRPRLLSACELSESLFWKSAMAPTMMRETRGSSTRVRVILVLIETLLAAMTDPPRSGQVSPPDYSITMENIVNCIRLE